MNFSKLKITSTTEEMLAARQNRMGKDAEIWKIAPFDMLPEEGRIYTVKWGYIPWLSFPDNALCDPVSDKQKRYIEMLSRTNQNTARELRIIMADNFPNMGYPEQMNKGQAHFIIEKLNKQQNAIGSIIKQLIEQSVFSGWVDLLHSFSAYIAGQDDQRLVESNPTKEFCKYLIYNGYKPEHLPATLYHTGFSFEINVNGKHKNTDEIKKLQSEILYQKQRIEKIRLVLTKLNSGVVTKILDNLDQGVL